MQQEFNIANEGSYIFTVKAHAAGLWWLAFSMPAAHVLPACLRASVTAVCCLHVHAPAAQLGQACAGVASTS